MALARVNVDVSIPSFGGRPPFVHVGAEVKVTALHAVIGGAIAAVIVWVAVGMPLPNRAEGDEPEGTDRVVAGRFSRTP